MASTLSLSELEKHAENIYEAIVVIAKRARQINEEQKRLLGMEVETDENTEEYEEEEVNKAVSEGKKYLKFPKPTRIALEEMLSGKLKFEYDEPENKDESGK